MGWTRKKRSPFMLALAIYTQGDQYMGVTLNFSRIEKSNEYITNRYDLFNLVEADYEKLCSYRKDTVSFKELLSVETLQKSDSLSDLGIYNETVFMFYRYPVIAGENSSKYINGNLLVVLFYPEPILQVVHTILNSSYILQESKASDQEVIKLKELKLMLEQATENNDYIESIYL